MFKSTDLTLYCGCDYGTTVEPPARIEPKVKRITNLEFFITQFLSPPTMPKESVWDYPRPPRLEQTAKRIRVIFAGKTIADTTRAYRLLETSHPPTYYIPPEDVVQEYLTLLPEQKTFCEFKGAAVYWTIKIDERRSEQAAWSYPEPAKNYLALKNHVAFYASRVDACFVDDEQVQSQSGDFYGGWITADITGPFKGAKGTSGW